MELSFVRETLIGLLLFSFFVAWKVGRKNGGGLGCIGFGYVSLVVFMVGAFAIGITALITGKTIDNISIFANGEKSVATVVSFSTHQDEDSDGVDVTMHTPVYKITTDAGRVYEIESGYSSGGEPVIGEQLSVYFNEANQHMVELSATSLIMLCGMFIMWAVLATSFVGILMYSFDYDMTGYVRFVQTAGTGFLIPFVMICFEALLIYAFFYGNDVPTWVSVVLLFFIGMLGLGIAGYIKQLINEGTPKWEKTESGSWGASWDNKKEVGNTKIKKKPKLGNPLNEKYRKKY